MGSVLSALYPGYTCSVPRPWFLRSEVPVSGEDTEQVHSGYSPDKEWKHCQLKQGMCRIHPNKVHVLSDRRSNTLLAHNSVRYCGYLRSIVMKMLNFNNEPDNTYEKTTA